MTDDDALELAIKIQSAKGDGEREQMEWKIKNDGWRSAGEFASYCCQCDSLHLKPWEEPPCEIDEDAVEDSPARSLLRRMIAAGVSRFHPDPMAALAE